MSAAELDAAGIREPWLRAAYRHCRRLHAAYGRTYFLATRLLTPARRPAVHALYGFARWADEIVDAVQPGADTAGRAAELDHLDRLLRAGLARGSSTHPVVAAVVDTAARYRIPHRHFAAFLRSMRMDLDTTAYPDYAALSEYVHGSAEVIGLQVLPVLGTVVPREHAEPHAAALGEAFQLTNFVRDVGEDLDRGRLYLPADELAAFGVDRDLLLWCRRTGRTDARVRRALAHLVARTRAVYRRARPGIGMLDPASRPCVATAYTLYGGILDAIVAADYDVLGRRAVVARRRRLAVAGPAVARTALTRACRLLRR
ncbi:phytoene/squalene synthase family protein [Gandjariella thermophila]|uniref:Phytoene synthase n=1 Tax=Gandjariella thermophila TaxID=1931992 RepID=A0A4D4J0V6_9PSEU|nr:phytoene/squalene synthase family protein [Gandjariella thermophila]GDY28712.1 phytoene synthase [Gandjariella thermophila]